MSKRKQRQPPQAVALPKAPTGMAGLDEITGGGLPRSRPTLVCGGAGCGKTLLATEFLVRGASEHGEPGIFVSFEETGEELAQNVRSLGFDLDDLRKRNLLLIDFVAVDRRELAETGEFDLDGLFIRLGYAIDGIKAKRVVLDSIETLFGGFSNQAILRSELQRLFRWLKDKGVTAVVTGERGGGSLTRHGLEEYISDCVILLDHRVDEQRSTRRLRIVKYRGTSHGTNEYPFIISEQGIAVVPITSLGLDHAASDERVSTGIPQLDAMLGAKGLFRGSTVLVSGTPGTGKTSFAAHFVAESCRRGERCLYFAFEESASQLNRNMRSIGIDLEACQREDLLRIRAIRPTAWGLETHLAELHRLIGEFKPRAVVLDPITNFLKAGSLNEAEAMLARLIDFLKLEQITAVFCSLTQASDSAEQSEVGVSSLVDTWILMRDLERADERRLVMYILKSRGMAHSHRVREYRLSDRGFDLKGIGRRAVRRTVTA